MVDQSRIDVKSYLKEDNDLEIPLNPDSKLLQFLLRNKPISLAYKTSIVCLSLGTLTLLVISIAMFASMATLFTTTITYFEEGGTTCQKKGEVCQIAFSLPNRLAPPIYLSYQLGDFFQNQRLFTQSKSNEQLQGVDISASRAYLCKPFVTNVEMGVTTSWNGTELDPDAVASPCGAFPKYFFNDTFVLNKSNGNSIPISEQGIAWPEDIGTTYRRTPDSASTQWIDPEDQHFAVWMRTAGIPNFRKIWGIIDLPLEAGDYVMSVTNNYQTSGWSGQKSFVLSTGGVWGGRNYLLPIAMLVAALVFGLAIAYIAKLGRQFTKLASLR